MTKKSTYHRDDLRGDLMRGGHMHVAAEGHEALSVRALANRVGVSVAAPYHYFPDRRALLLALAVDGFEQLFALGEGIGAMSLSAPEKLIRLASVFLRFQEEHPRLLELMYESELTRPTIDAAIAAQQLRGFALIGAVVLEARPEAGEREARRRAVGFWASLYGFASLVAKELLQPFAEDEDELKGWREGAIAQAVSAAIMTEAAAS